MDEEFLLLHDAVSRSDLEQVSREIQNGADVNEFSRYVTPLHLAKDLLIVQLLIANGADVFAKACSNMTTLHTVSACETEDSQAIMKLLLDIGLDINAPNIMGITPLLHALEKCSSRE